MLKISIVIFRECLEIALLFGVILASTTHIKNSRIYVLTGSIAGVVLSSLLAFLIGNITKAYDGYGDEILDVAIILTTTLMISITVVWMQGYTKKIRHDIQEISQKIKAGSLSSIVLSAIVAATILREGAEIILLLYSISSTELLSATDYIIGLGVGSFSGFVVGLVIYSGLIRISGKYIFKVSTILLILIAAGLASEAAAILTSVGIIDVFTEALWDSSWLVNDYSIAGKLLRTTVGYYAKPNIMQIIFYFSTVIITIIMIKLRSIFIKRKHA